MKLLFDESLSPRLVESLRDLFLSPRVRSETALPVEAISESLNTPQRATSFWCRQTAISKVY
jgi:predicted nuclease of predicted toxin-antitoxin system